MSVSAYKSWILILDEPFVGLDPVGKEIFKRTILNMAHEQNIPVLFSSHDLDDVDEICDRVVMISTGKNSWINRLNISRLIL